MFPTTPGAALPNQTRGFSYAAATARAGSRAWFCTLLLLASGAWGAEGGRLELRQGDHLSIIGNTLAERMQHFGALETLLAQRFPDLELVVRNLGYSGDELVTRLRSAGFGSPDEHLTRHETDVVFAFFGYNESFGDEAGLAKFQQELQDFVRHTLEQKYNGQTAPELVLFSPIACENLHDPNLPDGSENNRRIEIYTRAMAEVAQANNVVFVDLYHPTLELFAKTDEPRTINGVHLNERGDKLVAEVIDQSLFGAKSKPADAKAYERIRAAVLDKNFYWFNRYRTVDGYSIYGGRADLAFVDGQTNRVVMQREMEVLDAMTAHRDRHIWAVARGQDQAVDDSEVPPFLEVKTNKPGEGPGGLHLFLGAEAAIEKMTLAQGMQVNLFASEEQFPELANPVQMSFDTRGRLWVTVMPSYPHWKPNEEMNDKVLILEDTDGDGRADVCKVFADKLHVPTGLEFYHGGLLVGQQPDLMFLQDTDGDDVADLRQRVLHGIDSADTHHALNSFVLDPGGALYFQEGTFHHTQVETPYGPPQRCANAGVYRYEPRTQKFDVYVSYGFANPHGHVFDRWGQDFVTDGTGNVNYFATAFSGHVDFPNKHAGMQPFFPQRTRPCPGTEILSSRHFPESSQGNYLVGNVIGFQGILQYKVRDDGSGFGADEIEPIISSTDANFRPTDLEIGPDGAIYFSDWQNPIIGHMQHNLRDPSRDRTHGRVYRITYPSRALLKPAKIAGQPVEKLLDLLKEPEQRVRYRAKIELGARPTAEVMAALDRWIRRLDKNDPEFEHHMLEALWMRQYHNVVDVDLLQRMLGSTDYRARAAATRVLCYWRDRVPEALNTFKKLAADPYPRVRLEAVRAASFFTEPDAVEVALISDELAHDYYLDYTRGETMKTLETYWRAALASGKPIPVTSPAGMRFFLSQMSVEQLLALEPSRPVYQELLLRPGLRDEQRRDALGGLARLAQQSELATLLDAIDLVDAKLENRDETVVFDLVRLLGGRTAEELAEVRPTLERLATKARQPVIRQTGFVALLMVDGNVDRAWELGTTSVAALADLASALPFIADPSLRASLYPKVEPLLDGLPAPLADGKNTTRGTYGRFVRIELPGNRTLTLAEVEVTSDGQNVAPRGTATQKNTAHGGEAKRGIDGNKSTSYGDGGQTHSEENTPDPWWELDLGEELPLETITIHNRQDGNLGQRLEGFKLQVLNASREVVFQQEKIGAPNPSLEIQLEAGGAAGQIRRIAMNALTYVRGQEAHTFERLSQFVRDDVDRLAAIRALERIGRAYWPADQARPLLDIVLAHLRGIPTERRTQRAALDVLEFADALSTLLPTEEARQVRAELGELAVRVVRIGTLPERMAYDKDVIAVQAGKPLEIVFENTDLMPHNLVVALPGSMAEIGMSAETTATQPGALERQYVPISDKILLSSRLVQPRQSQQLSFVAPTKPGVYPYVCTYPGHWRRMYGALYVVENLEEYLAAPEEYLASHDLVAQDDLLKDRRPRTEWKLEDLEPAVLELASGRTFGNGKQMFQVASCVACHRLNNVGNLFGPDLTKLDVKFKPVDVLREMLDPSAKINEKFQTWIFETEDGGIHTGLVLEESASEVKLIENPLLKAEPIVLKTSEIARREKSKLSIMPKGLLDKLTREEILDLIAYVYAKGDQKHELFEGAHDHHHDHGAGR